SGSTLILRDAQLACTLTASLTEGGNQMSDQLFAAIRRGKVKPGMAAEFAKRVEAGALPVMKKMDGFKGYYLIAGVPPPPRPAPHHVIVTVRRGGDVRRCLPLLLGKRW